PEIVKVEPEHWATFDFQLDGAAVFPQLRQENVLVQVRLALIEELNAISRRRPTRPLREILRSRRPSRTEPIPGPFVFRSHGTRLSFEFTTRVTQAGGSRRRAWRRALPPRGGAVVRSVSARPNAGVQAPARPRPTGPVPADVPARRSPATTGSAEPVVASRAELRVRGPTAPGRAPAPGVARLVRGSHGPA